MKVYPLYIPCPVCHAGPNDHCRDLVTNAPQVAFHSARVAAAGE